MATINGKPSIYKSLENPTLKSPTYSERVTDFAAIAEGMAGAEARKHTLCPNCQEQMVAWRLANPNATKLDAESAHTDIWSECPSCVTEYSEWSETADRAAELETAEHEAYEAHLEAQAEEAELARLGDAAMECINGHDLKWQAGVA